MKDSIKMALIYVYCQQVKMFKNGEFKGLRAKQSFDYIKTIKRLASAYERNEIKDFEEVLSYGDQ